MEESGIQLVKSNTFTERGSIPFDKKEESV